MLEKEILKVLNRVSLQLETISQVQNEIKEEITSLYKHLLELREHTLKNLEERFPQRPIDSILN